MSLKPVSPGVESHVKSVWSKGIEQGAINEEVVFVEQYYPTKEMINDFEVRRNELENAIKARVQTMQAFYQPAEEKLVALLKDGFFKTLGLRSVIVTKDPSVLVHSNRMTEYNRFKKLLLCRVSLGKQGVDYKLNENKYIIENPKSIIPAFLVTYAAPGEAVSLTPLDLGGSKQQQQQQHHHHYDDEEELVFEEAKIVRYDEPAEPHRNVFGDVSNSVDEEEKRILRHAKGLK